MDKKILLVFTKNPELGKCKTRLAKSIGSKNALKVYKHLLEHTAKIINQIETNIAIFYSDFINSNDIWSNNYHKKLQSEGHLGLRMENAFEWAFKKGYEKVGVIGTDLLSLTTLDIHQSFELLDKNDVVFGPAEDGGYYLMAMNTLIKEAFFDKEWSTSSVLEQSIKDLETKKIGFLKVKNDIDTYEDLIASGFDINQLKK